MFVPSGSGDYGNLSLSDSFVEYTPSIIVDSPAFYAAFHRNVFYQNGGIDIQDLNNVNVSVRNNTFIGQQPGYKGGRFAVSACNVSGSSEITVEYNSFLSTDRRALILPAGCESGRMIATDNFWNTTDTTVIDSMIFDRKDDVGSPGYIQYTPFLTQPHSNTPAAPQTTPTVTQTAIETATSTATPIVTETATRTRTPTEIATTAATHTVTAIQTSTLSPTPPSTTVTPTSTSTMLTPTALPTPVDPNAPTFELLGSIGGSFDTVAVSGTHAFIGQSNSLTVLDVSNPGAPVQLARQPLSDATRDIKVVGNHAYVAEGDAGLQIIDVSDPLSPTLHGTIKLGIGAAQAVDVVGNLAYVGSAGLQIIDVSNPVSPTLLGSLTGAATPDVQVAGNFAYVVTDGGLQIIDVSDPISPTLRGKYQNSDTGVAVQAVGNIAYFASSASGLHIIDVRNPDKPIRRGFLSTPAHGLQVVGNRAYILTFHYDRTRGAIGGFLIVDISDPGNPIRLGETYNLEYDTRQAHVVGGVAYVADGESGLRIIDVSNAAYPTEHGIFATLSAPHSLRVADKHAYIVDSRAGGTSTYPQGDRRRVKSIDVNDPNHPIVRSTFAENTEVVEIADNVAYVGYSSTNVRTGPFGGVYLYDVGDPSIPTSRGELGTDGVTDHVHVAGDLAYVSQWRASQSRRELTIFDVSNPMSSTRRGSFALTGAATSIQGVDTLVYVASGGRLDIIDVSNSESPTLRGHFIAAGTIINLQVVGDLVYLAEGADGLQIVNVADPGSPTLHGAYTSASAINDIQVAGTVAYAAASDGLQILDVSDSMTPILRSTFSLGGAVSELQVIDDLIYALVDNYNRLQILRVRSDSTSNVFLPFVRR